MPKKITSQLWIRISAVAPSFGGTEQNQRNRQSHPRIRHRKKGPNKHRTRKAEKGKRRRAEPVRPRKVVWLDVDYR